jgi:hypothetical protein
MRAWNRRTRSASLRLVGAAVLLPHFLGCAEDPDPAPAVECDPIACFAPRTPECDGQSVVSFTATGECNSDGTCVYQTVTNRCEDGCLDGECTSDPCDGLACNAPPGPVCEGQVSIVWNLPGRCEAGACFYTEVREDCEAADRLCDQGICVATQVEDPCAGVRCTARPEPSCDDQGRALTFAADGTCNAEGGCDHPVEAVDDCPARNQLCLAGACVVNDPCLVAICDTPPSPACSGNAVVTFGDEGTCQRGECEYPRTTTPCAASEACVDGLCVPASDPCADLDCSAAPDPVCEGDILVESLGDGRCEGGACQWTERRTDCTVTALFCSDGRCFDACTSLACDVAPSPPRCEGEVLVRAAVPGNCSDGVCHFAEERIDCEMSGQICLAGRCQTL